MFEKNKPLISVLMPVFNSAHFLSEAIESIINQTVTDFEFLIIYDESKDESLEIIRKFLNFDSRLKLIYGDNLGIIGALNKGLELSDGHFIARMDADDISYSNRFEKQIEVLREKGADICGCDYVRVDENNKVIRYITTPIDEHSIHLNFCYGVPFPHPGVMLRSSKLKKYNLSYGAGEFKIIEDFDLWIEMFLADFIFTNVDEVLLRYRIHENKISSKKINIIRIQSSKLIKKIHVKKQKYFLQCFNILLKKSTLSEAEIDSTISFVYLEVMCFRFDSFLKLSKKIGLFFVFYGLFPSAYRQILSIVARYRL